MTNATWVGAEVPRIMGPCELEVRQLLDLCIDAALPARDPIGDAYLAWIEAGWSRWPHQPATVPWSDLLFG